MSRDVPFSAIIMVFCCVAGAGCNHPASRPATTAPSVTVAYPVHRLVTDYHEYTGQMAAVETVNVQAQVTGYLQKISFKEGDEVAKGALLYTIDPAQYQAAYNQAVAQVKLQQANLVYNTSVYRRDVELGRGATAPETTQKDLAAMNTSRAEVQAAQAAAAQAKLNLGWTEVKAPITGQVGRTLITPGNLVVANLTVLTNIVSQDPMYVYFDVDEPTAEAVQELIREGKFKSYREGYKVPVFIRLANETGYPHEGYINFVNNQVTATTATLTIRGIFANPKPKVGPRLLSPGMFVNVRLAVSPPYSALLVDQDVIGTDQTLKYLYIVDPHNQVVRKTVQLGAQHGDLVVVTKGLEPADRVMINGLLHVKPGMTVQPTLASMPEPRRETNVPAPPSVSGTPAGGLQ